MSHEEIRAESPKRVLHECAPMTRRAALRLAAGAGTAVAVAPYLARLERRGNPFDVRGVALASDQHLDWPVPPIVTRAQWGANESLRKDSPVFNPVVKKIIVHHTGTPNDITDYAGLLRGIFSNELDNGYIDVAYNWLIDPNGRIYEGRWAQNYPSGAPHTGERANPQRAGRARAPLQRRHRGHRPHG